ncbi:MAG: hypothetical protein KVP17_004446 [Porospora cf. gigantea B]|uniref:uncharacterized protein n=1 Tax=Porospora cf. gigantea B TaxID=2853592 RepID=UPI00357184E2|nr:MAG: hypothetical protein KVP17_004446 [Porospora cf. gigantea B]
MRIEPTEVGFFPVILCVPPFESLRSQALTEDSLDPPLVATFLTELRPLNAIPAPAAGTFERRLYDDLLCVYPPSTYAPLSTGQLDRLLEEVKAAMHPSRENEFHRPCIQFLSALTRHGMTPSMASQIVESDLAYMVPPGLFFIAQESGVVRSFIPILSLALQSALVHRNSKTIENCVSKYCLPAARWLVAAPDTMEMASMASTFRIIATAMCRYRTTSVLVDVSLWWVAALIVILGEPSVPLLRSGTAVQMDESSRRKLGLSFFRVALVQLSLAAQGAALKPDPAGAWIGLALLGVSATKAPELSSLPTPIKLDLDQGFLLSRKRRRTLQQSSPGKQFSCMAVSGVMMPKTTPLTTDSTVFEAFTTKVSDQRHENGVLCNLLALLSRKQNPPTTVDPTEEARLLDDVRTGSSFLSVLISDAAEDYSLPKDIRDYLQMADPIASENAYWEQLAANQISELDSTAALLTLPIDGGNGWQKRARLLLLVSVIAVMSDARELFESTISLFPSISFRDWTKSLDFLVVCATCIRCHPQRGSSVIHKALEECIQLPMPLHQLPWLTNYPPPLFLIPAAKLASSLLNLTAVMMDCAGRWIEKTKARSLVAQHAEAVRAMARCCGCLTETPVRPLCTEPIKESHVEAEEEHVDSKSEPRIYVAKPSNLSPFTARLPCHPVQRMSPLPMMSLELSIGQMDIYANWRST